MKMTGWNADTMDELSDGGKLQFIRNPATGTMSEPQFL